MVYREHSDAACNCRCDYFRFGVYNLWMATAGREMVYASGIVVVGACVWPVVADSRITSLGYHPNCICCLSCKHFCGTARGGWGICDSAVVGAAIWLRHRCGSSDNWGSLGRFFAIAAVSYQSRQQAKWYAGYFEQAQRLLAETLDHRAELVQALDDLSHANRQLALMNKRVNALQSIAEDAQAAKTRFVARVSHEFRTPLNMIIGLTDLLIEKPENYDAVLSPRMRDALRVVHRNSQHLSDMVNDVLDLSRIETDHVVLRRERIPIQAIIHVAVEAVRPLIENKRLEMRLDIPENIPDVYCDRTRIEQVVLNLLSNAVRYTDQGFIAIEARQQTNHLCVRVTDTGQGISPQDRERIFEPFAQGTSTVWRNKGGTGLGLSISKQFIELHEGRIWVESELGVGTTFAFELPISSWIEHLDTFQQSVRPGQKIQEEWLWYQRSSKPNLPDSQQARPLLAVLCRTALSMPIPWGWLARSLSRSRVRIWPG